MKHIFKTATIALSALLVVTSCAKWEEQNTDRFGVTDKMLEADYNNIGAYYPQILQSVYFNFGDYAWEFQLNENLTADTWVGYCGNASLFANNINCTTYAMLDGWIGNLWNISYNYVMAPIFNSIQPQTDNDEYYYFYAPALIAKVMTMSQVVNAYGPAIYSAYGADATVNTYDSVEDAYKQFFVDLDTAIANLDRFIKENPDSKPFKNFDEWCDGDFTKWIRLANTIRLRLAMHIVKADPATARAQAEKAISNSYGVLEGSEVVAEHGASWKHPLYTLVAWTDCFAGAVITSYMSGYNDPRAKKYFTAATDERAAAANVDYVGVRMGIPVMDGKDTKGEYMGYSVPANGHEDPYTLCSAAEAYFLRAEGVLRGWNMGGLSAREYYQAGVMASFTALGVKGAEDYLASDATMADYKDFANPANDIAAVSDVTPKWDESLSNEKKLEKIIVQKYIAIYPDGEEAWTEMRRTGYPKIYPILVNNSNGVLKDNDIVRRMPYHEGLKANDPTGYASAVSKLGGADNAATRLWWDKDTPNF